MKLRPYFRNKIESFADYALFYQENQYIEGKRGNKETFK